MIRRATLRRITDPAGSPITAPAIDELGAYVEVPSLAPGVELGPFPFTLTAGLAAAIALIIAESLAGDPTGASIPADTADLAIPVLVAQVDGALDDLVVLTDPVLPIAGLADRVRTGAPIFALGILAELDTAGDTLTIGAVLTSPAVTGDLTAERWLYPAALGTPPGPAPAYVDGTRTPGTYALDGTPATPGTSWELLGTVVGPQPLAVLDTGPVDYVDVDAIAGVYTFRAAGTVTTLGARTTAAAVVIATGITDAATAGDVTAGLEDAPVDVLGAGTTTITLPAV